MNGNGKLKKEVEAIVVIGFIQDFCPNSGYNKNMTDEEALAITPCVPVGNLACRTHKYDPDNEL